MANTQFKIILKINESISVAGDTYYYCYECILYENAISDMGTLNKSKHVEVDEV